MKLNLTIIADKLTDLQILDYSIKKERPLSLRFPVIYTGESEFRSDRLYIAYGDKLSSHPIAMHDASLICIGYPPASYYSHKWDLLCLESSTDLIMVMNILMDLFTEYDDLEKQLDTVLFHKNPYLEIGKIAYSLFNNPVYATDAYDKILFLQYDSSKPDHRERYRYHSSLDYISPEEREIIYMDSIFPGTIREETHAFFSDAAMKIYGVNGVIFNLYHQHSFQASLWIEEVYHPIKDKDYVLLEWIGGYIRRLMEYDRRRGIAPSSEFEQVIVQLLTIGQWDSRYNSVISSYGWKRDDPYVCICTSGADKGASLTPTLLDAEVPLRTLFRSQHVTLIDNLLVQLVNLRVEPLHEAQIEQRIRMFFRGKNVVSGISTISNDLRKAGILYTQACQALEYAFSPNHLNPCRFQDCVLDIMLKRIVGEDSIHFFLIDSLNRLIRYDMRTNGDLVKTLCCYLEYNLSPTRTQEVLHIARTTCIYRINRVTEITGLDLTDPHTVLYLRILFQMDNFNMYLQELGYSDI